MFYSNFSLAKTICEGKFLLHDDRQWESVAWLPDVFSCIVIRAEPERWVSFDEYAGHIK